MVQRNKAVLVDVRLGMDYDKQHAEGAVSVPMFRITAGNSAWDKAKKVAMAAIFMRPTGGWPAELAGRVDGGSEAWRQ